MDKRAIIITALVRGQINKLVDISTDDLIICADGGWVIASEEGIVPDVIIGDFDSSEQPIEINGDTPLRGMSPTPANNPGIPDTLDTPGTFPEGVCPHLSHAKIIKLEKEKDDTDTLACVKYALSEGINDYVIVGGLSGELPHTFANIQVLSFLADMQCSAKIVDGDDTAVMLDGVKLNFFEYMTKLEASTEAVYVEETGGIDTPKDSNSITITPRVAGSKFSVFSYEVRSEGIFIIGAKYELKNSYLTQSYPIGVNNEFIEDTPVTIAVRRGRLLIIY